MTSSIGHNHFHKYGTLKDKGDRCKEMLYQTGPEKKSRVRICECREGNHVQLTLTGTRGERKGAISSKWGQ